MFHYEDLNFLSFEQAEKITSQTEKIFALKCLAVGCLVAYQVPVNSSWIDFLIIYPKVPRNIDGISSAPGILVEITLLDKKDQNKKIQEKYIKGRKRKVQNTTGRRKIRQIKAMESSGYHWTILYKENLRKIMGIKSK